MPEIERSFGDTDLGRFLRALGALIIGAFGGAIIGTPTITGVTAIPHFGIFTVVDAAVGAFLFLTGMRLLQSNAPRGQIWLGGVCVGGVTGAFIGAMFPLVGSTIMGVVVALLFGSFVIWSPYRDDPRAGIVWTLSSGVLVGLFFFSLASLFPIVQYHHATGYLQSVMYVCGPVGIMGVIGGLIFARQTGSRKRLTLAATGLMVLLGLVPFGIYHMPVRTISFPADRSVGTIRYSNWFDFSGHPAQGTVKVPLRGIINLQLDRDAGADLSFLAEMPGLRELDATGLVLSDDAVARIAMVSGLTFLNLAQTPISDAGLKHLAALHHLERLVLDGTKITGSGLDALTGLRNLRELSLGSTPVTNEALRYVAAIPNLRVLNLFMTPISDIALQHLMAAEQLIDLDVSMTQVTNDGLQAFREERPGCKVLPELQSGSGSSAR